MSFLRTLLFGIVALALSGCTGVYVSQPLGTKPHVLVATDWEGTWTIGDSTAKTRVVDSAQGKLELIAAKFNQGKPTLEITELVITETGDWLFATVLSPDHPERLEWARVKLKDDQLIAWLPVREQFRALIQSGKLHGQLDDKDVYLAPPTASELAALTAGTVGVPFKWDDPLVLRRISR